MTRRDIAFWDYFKMHIDYQLGYQTSLPILKHKNKDWVIAMILQNNTKNINRYVLQHSMRFLCNY